MLIHCCVSRSWSQRPQLQCMGTFHLCGGRELLARGGQLGGYTALQSCGRGGGSIHTGLSHTHTPISDLHPLTEPMKNRGMDSWNSRPFTNIRSPTVSAPARQRCTGSRSRVSNDSKTALRAPTSPLHPVADTALCCCDTLGTRPKKHRLWQHTIVQSLALCMQLRQLCHWSPVSPTL
jgi:hypothetical protein